MNPLSHIHEVLTAPCYRGNPRATLQYTYAKLRFARDRVLTPEMFLERLGISPSQAFDGYSRWRAILEPAAENVRRGNQFGGVSLEDGKILYGIVRATKPEYVIETGVASGVSNSFLNAALLENGFGTLYSIELPHSNSGEQDQDGSTLTWQDHGVGWAVPTEIRRAIGSRNVLILEDVRTALPALLGRLPRVDVFFHDDLHTPDHMLWEYRTVWPHLKRGGVLVSDDANFGWIRFCRESGIRDPYCANLQRLTAVRKA